MDRSEASFADLLAPPFVLAPWDLVSDLIPNSGVSFSRCGTLLTLSLPTPPHPNPPHTQAAEVAAYEARDPKDDSDSEEDTSEAAASARHEAVLSKMRERAALIAQLKRECKELGAGGGHSGAAGGGSFGRSGATSPRGGVGGHKRRNNPQARKGNIDNLRRAKMQGGGSAIAAAEGDADVSMDVSGNADAEAE